MLLTFPTTQNSELERIKSRPQKVSGRLKMWIPSFSMNQSKLNQKSKLICLQWKEFEIRSSEGNSLQLQALCLLVNPWARYKGWREIPRVHISQVKLPLLGEGNRRVIWQTHLGIIEQCFSPSVFQNVTLILQRFWKVLHKRHLLDYV